MTKDQRQDMAELAYVHEPRMGQTEFDTWCVCDSGEDPTRADLDEAWAIYEELDDAEGMHREATQNYNRGLGI